MSLYDDASLIMYPSGYKEDKIYSLKPTDGSGDLTFSRASTATRVNADGLIEEVPVNKLTYSEQFDNAAWGVLNSASVTANTTTAPNGTTTADTLSFSANPSSTIYQSITVPAGQTTLSVYAKTASGTKQFRLRIDTPSGNSSSDFTATTEWQRFDFSLTTTGTGVTFYIINDNAGTAGSIFIWGAQLNSGSTAKPYFPTTDRLNVPRIDYTGGGCGKLLLEPQRTNLVTYSESFDNAAWEYGGITKTANAAISPDGTSNADKIEITTLVTPNLRQSILVTQSTNYTFSFYAKSSELSVLKLAVYNLNGAAFIFENTEKPINDEWSRVTVSFATPSGCSSIRVFIFRNSDSLGSFYVWGAQLEEGSYATSYIPTASATATRIKDSASKTGISSLIGQTEGTMFAEFTYNGVGNTGVYEVILVIGTNTSNLIALNKNNTTSELYAYAINGGVIQVNSVGIAGTNIIGTHKVALAYKLNDYAVYLDGVKVFTDTIASVPTCSSVYVGQSEVLAQQLGGTINQAILFKTRLSNAELATLTTL